MVNCYLYLERKFGGKHQFVARDLFCLGHVYQKIGKNEKEHYMGVGPLFEELADKTATFTYAQRIWQFFKGLFEISFSKIFELFEIEDDFQSFFDTLNQSVCRFAPIKGCET